MDRLDELRAWKAEELIEKLEDPNPNIRRDAARLLGIMKNDKAVPALIEALSDKYVNVRLNAAFALEKIKDPRAVPELVYTYLKDENDEVRKGAAWALRMIRDSLERWDWPQQLTEFEQKLEDGFRKMERSRKHFCVEAGLEVAKLKNMIAKRRDAISWDKKILRIDKPNRPKSKKGIYKAIERVRNA